MGNPAQDERNACLVIGSQSAIDVQGLRAQRVGLYLWEGASAKLEQCSFSEGLHGLYVWGRSRVTAVDVRACNMQGSGVCVTEGATVDLQVEAGRVRIERHRSR